MKDRGVLTVFSGFSGAGKGTVMKELLRRYPDQYALSVSCTSREPRPGEREGIEYFFISREEFEKRIAAGYFLEHAEYVGNYYGTPAPYVIDKLEAGIDVILEIELQGALQIREKLPEAVLVFLLPPTADELERRLRGRGTETEEKILARLARAVEEAEEMVHYDYLIVNDDLDECVEEVHSLIHSCHHTAKNRRELMEEMRKQVQRFRREA